jgi:two-component system sensor histidine kinase VicK
MEQANIQFDEFRAIGDYINEGIILYDLRTETVTYANSAVTDLVGIKENASASQIMSLLVDLIPEDREYLKNQFRLFSKKKVIPNVEFKLRHERKDLHLCCNAYVLSDHSTILVHARDITKTRQWENYLVEFGARKNTLLDNLGHHINGALNLMYLLTKEAEKHIGTSPNDNLKTLLGLLKENSKRSIEVIHDLMKKEHIESPTILVKKTRLNIVDKIRIIHNELQHVYSHRKFHFHCSNDPIYAFIDDLKLLQVVNNYLSNAIKFSPPERPILIAINETNHEVIVSVKDEGIGIPDELQPFVFSRNPAAGRTGLNGEKSVGVGLSICKNLIELMGGRVWFASKEDSGSTFYLSLPKN